MGSCSTTVIEISFLRSSYAAVSPAGPAPMITTCRRSCSAVKVPTAYQRSKRGSGSEYVPRAPGLVQRSGPSHLVDLDQGVAKALDPVRLVHADESYAPGQRIATAARHPAGDQGVQDRTFRHPQARHHRHAEGREDLGFVAAPRAPRNLPLEMTLRLTGDLYAFLTSLLPESVDPSQPGGRPRLGSGSGGKLHVRQRADDEHLVAVGGNIRRGGKPSFG